MLIFYLRVIYSHRIGTEMDRVKFCWLGDEWEEWCWWAKVSKYYCECGLSIGQGLSRQPPRWRWARVVWFCQIKIKSNQIKSGKKKVFDDLQIATWERLPSPPTLAPASSCLFNPALLLSLAKFLNSQQQ